MDHFKVLFEKSPLSN